MTYVPQSVTVEDRQWGSVRIFVPEFRQFRFEFGQTNVNYPLTYRGAHFCVRATVPVVPDGPTALKPAPVDEWQVGVTRRYGETRRYTEPSPAQRKAGREACVPFVHTFLRTAGAVVLYNDALHHYRLDQQQALSDMLSVNERDHRTIDEALKAALAGRLTTEGWERAASLRYRYR